MTVYLDGNQAGVAPPQQQLRIECEVGSHRVHVRQWWFRSKPLDVEVKPGAGLMLTADLRGSPWTKVWTAVVSPGRSLVVLRVDAAP
jgi:hypothetical protein